jgi:hypothetical protein
MGPVTAQLLNQSTGVCWEGNYTTAKKDTDAQFKAQQGMETGGAPNRAGDG